MSIGADIEKGRANLKVGTSGITNRRWQRRQIIRLEVLIVSGGQHTALLEHNHLVTRACASRGRRNTRVERRRKGWGSRTSDGDDRGCEGAA
jgi:hypothetical protein